MPSPSASRAVLTPTASAEAGADLRARTADEKSVLELAADRATQEFVEQTLSAALFPASGRARTPPLRAAAAALRRCCTRLDVTTARARRRWRTARRSLPEGVPPRRACSPVRSGAA